MTPSNLDLVSPVARPRPSWTLPPKFLALPSKRFSSIASLSDGLLRLSGGLEPKLFAHGSRRVAYFFDCAFKFLLCHAKMLRPMPDLISTTEDNLTAVAGDACVR